MIARLALASAAVAIGISAVVAQSNPVTERQAAMKAVGSQNSIATEMLAGKRPFSEDAARQVFMTFSDSATRMRKLFPPDSKEGNTKALPAIWEKWDDFDARLAKFAEQSKAAAGKVTDLGSFKSELSAVRQNCGGCHKPYRAPS